MDLAVKVAELPPEKVVAFLKWQVSKGQIQPVLALFPEITTQHPDLAEQLEKIREKAAQKEAMLASSQPAALDVSQERCDGCGATLHRALAHAETVVCNYCGAFVGTGGKEKQPGKHPERSFLRLGMIGDLDGKRCQVVGRTVWQGSCREWDSEDSTWESTPWHYEEWLLLTEDRVFRYLSHDDEGISLSKEYTPKKPGMPGRNDRKMDLGEGSKTVKEHGDYHLVYMEGEFGWRQTLKETVRTAEYESGGRTISVEQRAGPESGKAREIEFFQTRDVEPRELLEAFDRKASLAEYDRRAAVVGSYRSWCFAAVGIAVLLAILGFATSSPGNVVLNQRVDFRTITEDDGVTLGPFRLEAVGRPHRIELISNIPDNSWAWIGAELLDAERDSLDAIDHEFWRESGRDSDGAWSERSVRKTHDFRLETARDYHLRLQLERGTARSGHVTVRVFEKTGLLRYYVISAVLTLVLGLALFRVVRTDDLIKGTFQPS